MYLVIILTQRKPDLFSAKYINLTDNYDAQDGITGTKVKPSVGSMTTHNRRGDVASLSHM